MKNRLYKNHCKLKNFIKKVELEKDFPQIAPCEENTADDNSSDELEEYNTGQGNRRRL